MDSLMARVKPALSRCSSLVTSGESPNGSGSPLSPGSNGTLGGSLTKRIPFLAPAGGPANRPVIPFMVPLVSSLPPVSGVARTNSYGDSAPSSGESTPLTPELRNAHNLGTLDPSLYQTNDLDDNYEMPPGHIGRIWFEVTFERDTEKLQLTLIKARNLPSRTATSKSACDPFVRIQLLPDDRRCLQTKFKKKTCSPNFDESFMFPISIKTIDERVLKFTVVDVDRNRRHQVIGHALYPLREHVYSDPIVVWRDLGKEVAETTLGKGQVRLSLCYNDHLERLTVAVFEGKGFSAPAPTSDSDYYMKVCLLQQGRVMKSKKTEISRKTADPSFNESFSFKLGQSCLDTTSISVTAMQHCSGKSDKQVGRLTVGSFMFARGKELEHWTEMTNQLREPVVEWHTLT